MKKTTLSIILMLVVNLNNVSSLESDIEELNLNFNQIKRLIASFSNENLIKAVNFATESTDSSKSLEHRISTKAKIRNGTISHSQFIESLPNNDTKKIDSVAQDILKASSYLLNLYCKTAGISNKDCVKFMSKYTLPETKLGLKCFQMRKNHHAYGRLLPASYQDGLHKIRRSISKKELPLPRVISNSLYTSGLNEINQRSENKLIPTTSEGVLDRKLSLSAAQWTQFLEHDLSKTVVRSMSNGASIECCDQESVSIQPRYLHPSCLPLVIPSDDSHYRQLRVTCLNYVRSALAVNDQCRFGSINQLNQATSRLDLSQLYGIDEAEQEKLRRFQQGLLLTSTDDGSLLPNNLEHFCSSSSSNETSNVCYLSGDSRVNANPLVTSLYTIFLRSHNQIAQKLRRMNPKWNDNQLFNVAKYINVAIYQKFIYNDWANVVLGKRTALEIRNKNFDHDVKKYKSDKVSNEFGTAAVKFYNTMLPGDVLSHQDDFTTMTSQSSENTIEARGSGKRREILKLQDSFYKPRDFSKQQIFDQLMNAILRQNSMAVDNSYVDDLSLQLYRSKMFDNKVFGGDSLAFDIQRTRDHGLQPYISYIKKCFNIRVTRWDDLRNIIKEEDLAKLRSIYESFHDIDLIVGGLSEIPIENATVGPTFSCILSDQLINSRLFDETFYNRKTDDSGEKVMKTVENYSATRFICDNTHLKMVQKNIFHIPSDENPLIDCSDYEKLPKLDLSYWLVMQSQA
ncbi:CLUMA_CG017992, isoform A [Clunio marinus]|uniref:CLUMA_CG017992, isoform A n=1 Tax=Clunio marinus TaxID=568069 RepID=A0A1J1IY46_9DIPT|nr:CLUMA_CG017992, isoform A [Clunio marinus]